jgi:uncharacterized membrane protein YobD (UPF0266 family)
MKNEIIRKNVFYGRSINIDFEKEHARLPVMLTLSLLLGHIYLLLFLIIIVSKTFESGMGVKRFLFFSKSSLVSYPSKLRIVKQICSAKDFYYFSGFFSYSLVGPHLTR